MDPLFKWWQGRVVIMVAFGSLIAELFLHRHSHFANAGFYAMDGWFGFYAMVGGIGTGLLLMVGWLLRQWLTRDKEYYSNDD